MRTKQIAAALAFTAGMTMLGGWTAQAETVDASNNTASSVAGYAPTDVNTSAVKGPYKWRLLCEAIRKGHNVRSKPCFETAIAWYYTTY